MPKHSPKSLPKSSALPHPNAKPERNAQLIEFYLAGHGQHKIADMYGISRGRVKEILVDHLGEEMVAVCREAKKLQQYDAWRKRFEANAEKKQQQYDAWRKRSEAQAEKKQQQYDAWLKRFEMKKAQAEKRRLEAEKKRTALYPVKHTKNFARTMHICRVYEVMRAQTPPATPKEIAKRLGISIALLWQSIHQKRHNILDFVRRVSSLNEAEVRTILEMREGGLTLAQIGKRFHLRTQQVSLALKKARALKIN